jgi:hypothetical protein
MSFDCRTELPPLIPVTVTSTVVGYIPLFVITHVHFFYASRLSPGTTLLLVDAGLVLIPK